MRVRVWFFRGPPNSLTREVTGIPPRRIRLSYVSDLENTPSGGGAYAVNWHAFHELEKRFDARYAGPIVPRPPAIENALSKLQRRVFHSPGKYSYFSERTLARNARLVSERVDPASDAIFFRSSGRWSQYRTSVRYFVYLDAVVHTFFHNTFDEADFNKSDLERIWQTEAGFLECASGVFFESEWGLREAVKAYDLRGAHYVVANRGGVIEPPAADEWSGELSLITMAMDFNQKGGDIVAEAYRLLKPKYPELEWHILGGHPPFDPRAIDGVTYEGILRPDRPDDAARLSRLLAGAFLCVHPTREDTSPLVVTEAAYFGCPAISMNMFGIPELVLNGRTGILLDAPATGGSVANAIESLLRDRGRYIGMRKAAREYSIDRFSWERVGTVIGDFIERKFGLDRAS